MQQSVLTLRSPAKVNLFLRIISKRKDGYHELASLFQAISLFDTLHFSFSDKDKFTCSKAEVPTCSKNLVLKALALFREKTSMTTPVHIHLEKNIPLEAGLGGGSSNAATTLWALNLLLGKPATLKNLTSWAAKLGSDVPFFLSQGTAYCTGRGEVIDESFSLSPQDLFVIKPGYGLSTPKVYQALELGRCDTMDPLDVLGSFKTSNPRYINDLEVPAFQLKPELQEFKFFLKKLGFPIVLLSGSGTSFFCLKNPSESIGPSFGQSYKERGEEISSLADTFYAEASFTNRLADHWY